MTLFYRSPGPNNMSEDQFGGQGKEIREGCVQGEAGIIDREICVVGNDLGHWSL